MINNKAEKSIGIAEAQPEAKFKFGNRVRYGAFFGRIADVHWDGNMYLYDIQDDLEKISKGVPEAGVELIK